MKERILTYAHIRRFEEFLREEEKSPATREKYLRDVQRFMDDLGSLRVTKERVADWKQALLDRGYAVRSVNSVLASVNSLFRVLGWEECRVKNIRIQRQTYCPEERELTREDYQNLLQTICSSGIRVSELRYFTVKALDREEITVSCKGKTRTIFLPAKLKKLLLSFARRRGIQSGVIFRNSKGEPLAQLADVLGHSYMDMTRLYIISTGAEHRKKIERMDLVMPTKMAT